MPMGLPSWPHGSDSSELVGCRSRYISLLLAARGSYLSGCTRLESRHRRKIGCVPTPWSHTRPAWVQLESLTFGRCTQGHSDSFANVKLSVARNSSLVSANLTITHWR